ncbi:MAG: VWA domain-containing protein [Terracidiphilus sp.]
MTIHRIALTLSIALLVALPTASAQQLQPSTSKPDPSASSERIQLDVVVSAKSGQPVNYLHPQDFTVLDNKSPRPITAFKVVTAAQEPVEVIVLIDAVNTPYEMVSYVRDQTEKFLKANEGTLAHPTTIAVLTDQGVQVTSGLSTNGNALSDVLEHHVIGLRDITRASQWGGNDRLMICLKNLQQLVAYASTLPGRKLILYISPGWPLLSGPAVYLDSRQQQQIFDNVVYFSSQLRQSKIALYDVNPFGVSEPMMAANYYQSFLKGLSKLSDAQYADLSLQVLAVQSGGLTLTSNSDVTGNIQKCIADADSWYEITFDPPPADKPNQYHHIEVRLDQPGLVARTRTGYYSNPIAANPSR